jgi:hypothetical protein
MLTQPRAADNYAIATRSDWHAFSRSEVANPLRIASAARFVEFAGSRGSTGSSTRNPAEILGLMLAGAGTRNVWVTGSMGSRRLNFGAVNAAALRELPALLARWLPDGRVNGREFTARNPRRADRHLGSFKVNLRTGRWADFATGDKGGDVVSLAAYLFGLSQIEAGRKLAVMLGLPDGEVRRE